MASHIFTVCLLLATIINVEAAPTHPPTHSGRGDATLNPTVGGPTSKPTQVPTAPCINGREGGCSSPTRSPLATGDTHSPTLKPTQIPTPKDTSHGNGTYVPTGPITSPTNYPLAPTYSHGADTDYPTTEPTKKPTLRPTQSPLDPGETRAPSPAPTPITDNPTTSPTDTTELPTFSPSTGSPTYNPTPDPTEAAHAADETEYTNSPTRSPNEQDKTIQNSALFDLTEILLGVFGIVLTAAICGLIYYYFQRKKHLVRAKSLSKAVKIKFEQKELLKFDGNKMDKNAGDDGESATATTNKLISHIKNNHFKKKKGIDQNYQLQNNNYNEIEIQMEINNKIPDEVEHITAGGDNGVGFGSSSDSSDQDNNDNHKQTLGGQDSYTNSQYEQQQRNVLQQQNSIELEIEQKPIATGIKNDNIHDHDNDIADSINQIQETPQNTYEQDGNFEVVDDEEQRNHGNTVGGLDDVNTAGGYVEDEVVGYDDENSLQL